MNESAYNPWLHRLAVLTACVALLPIGMGALVTTKGAGMAFPDWPTSDGYGMIEYPWLKSAGDKFLEHGHRLAGMTIGICSILLCAAAVFGERRNWVKSLAAIALLSVIAQGLLGGLRVRQDSPTLAMVHGSFAALVFALLAAIALVTGRGWREAGRVPIARSLAGLRVLAVATVACVFIQYILGGLVRHQGSALHEHLGFAFVTALMVVCLAMAAMASDIGWFRAPAAALAVTVLVQLALGAGTWFTKFGGLGDEVAVYGSTRQVVFRTSHVLGGMLLFAATVVLALRICRMHWVHATGHPRTHDSLTLTGSMSAPISMPISMTGAAP